MPTTKEYMKEYVKEYHTNSPEFYANELKKNNEKTTAKYHSNPEYLAKISEYKRKYYQQKKLAELESVKVSEN